MAIQDDPNALKVGAKIAGYEILRVIGSGGFGITYEAESPITGKHVAIKEFFPRGIASREESTRIIFAARDAEIAAWALKRFESSTTDQCRLKHPNIVDVIHYVKDNDTGYMIMEYVEGETLEQWLHKRSSLPSPGELRLLIEPIFDALEYLHGRKLIHRDIAPDNIMVRPDGTPVIIDFGAVKLIQQQTQLRSQTNRSFTVSKQFYSPPEQVQENSDKLDARADVYSVAATIYRALAGRPPISAEERTQKIAFGNGDPLTPLEQLAPQTQGSFTSAIDRALAFNARDRVASITELRDALGWSSVSSGAATIAVSAARTPRFSTVPSSAPSPSQDAARKRTSPWRWAGPVAVALTLAGVFLLVGGNWIGLYDARVPSIVVRESQQQPPAQPQAAVKPETPGAVQAPAQPNVAAVDMRDLSLRLNTELSRVGCGIIPSKESWNEASQKALLAFNQHAGTKFDVAAPSAAALDAVRAKAARVCPLVCAAGLRANGENCVAACGPGFVIAANGACVRPQPPVVRAPQPPQPTQQKNTVCRWGDHTQGELPNRMYCNYAN